MAHLDKRALFDFVGYEPHAGQILVHRSKAKFRILACGVRWGKSTCASMEALAALMRPSDHTIGWTVGPTYELSKRVFMRVVDVMHERFEHHIEAFEPREHRLVIRNLSGGRSELRGKSADNPDSLLGEGLDFLVVDEAARIDDRVWTEHLSQRLIDKNGWAAILSTPAGKKGWFYKLHSRGVKARDADVESWASPSSANPNLRASIIEAERARLDPETFAAQYEAKFCGPGVEGCDRCGGPQERGRRILIDMGQGIPRCEECHEYVDEAGRCVVGVDRMGNRAKMMIVTCSYRAPPLELVEDRGEGSPKSTG